MLCSEDLEETFDEDEPRRMAVPAEGTLPKTLERQRQNSFLTVLN
jgi:hypothetical protein